MNSNWCNAGELINYSVGGGWGKEKTDNDYVCKVAVIRGADFPSIDKGEYRGLPIRWEKLQKATNASLQEGDIVIEISGGTELRPTGRTILITKELLEAYDCPIIPASFCRLIRSKDTVNSVYFYYWLQEMYRAGRTWGYQNRSTGLSNFQYKTFCSIESVFIPGVDTQRKIASILLAFDKKRRLLTKLNDYLTELLLARFNHWLENRNDCWGPFETAEISSLDLYITDYVANGSFASLKENVELLNNQGYAYFMRNTDLKTREFNVYVTEHSYKFLSKSTLYGGEVIISNVGDVGSVHRCPSLNKPMTLGNNEIMIKGSIGGQSANNFLYLLFTSRYGQHLIDSVTGGSVQRKFNKTDFKSIKIPIPSTRGLISFNNWVQPIFDILEGNFREIDQIKELKDVLLFKLISKEINNASTD